MNDLNDELQFTVPLTLANFRSAEQFSQTQINLESARQVFLNSLAVQAVKFYCDCLEIETSVKPDRYWDSQTRKAIDTVNLQVKYLGTLECHPVLPGSPINLSFLEDRADRFGSIIVEIDEVKKQARLLEFIAGDSQEKLPPIRSRSLGDFLVRIEGIATMERLERMFTAGWNDVEGLLVPSHRGTVSPSPSVLPIRKAKPVQLSGKDFLVMVQVKPSGEEQIHFHSRVYPRGASKSLPADLELAFLDRSSRIVKSARAKTGDNCLKLNTFLSIGETLTIKIKLASEEIIEKLET